MARRLCDRCPCTDDLQPYADFDLCPVCLYDVREAVNALVKAGRSPEVQLRARHGERWEQLLNVIVTYGYVTCRLFSTHTGLSAVASRDYIKQCRKLGKLVGDPKKGRYYLPCLGDVNPEPEKPELSVDNTLSSIPVPLIGVPGGLLRSEQLPAAVTADQTACG